eukprot:7387957-Lingulodinium_polyedra.AAC.1
MGLATVVHWDTLAMGRARFASMGRPILTIVYRRVTQACELEDLEQRCRLPWSVQNAPVVIPTEKSPAS